MKLIVHRQHDGTIVYRRHPNGWTIRRQERDYDGRSYRGGLANAHGPKVWWEVRRSFSSSRVRKTFNTLRAAREWCDRHDSEVAA